MMRLRLGNAWAMRMRENWGRAPLGVLAGFLISTTLILICLRQADALTLGELCIGTGTAVIAWAPDLSGKIGTFAFVLSHVGYVLFIACLIVELVS